MAPGDDQEEMICYHWWDDIRGSMGMDCPCLGDLVEPSSYCFGVVAVSAGALKFVRQTKLRIKVPSANSSSSEIENKSPMRSTLSFAPGK